MKNRNIIVAKANYTPAPQEPVELVERKGLGHPDSLIDGVVENISHELCKAYINDFGRILHHNVDKGQICGGGTYVEFGGGKFLKPIYVLLSGRATQNADSVMIPSQHIALKAAKDYLRKVRNLDVDDDVIVDSRISEGSKDLVELFLRGPKIPFANDTSFGSGYAPLDDLERIVIETEKMLNHVDYKKSHPEVGEDIKIMGKREGDHIKLTVACAFVSKYITSLDEYVSKKEHLKKNVERFTEKLTKKDVEIFINTADDEKNGSIYITLTGTSAEMGDDGSVGRGNRVNGLITPYRSMTLEAAAGKNPVSHVGKIYSVLAFEIANQIAKECTAVDDVTITLLSQIGKPIDEPHVASIGIISKDFDRIKDKAAYIADAQLEDITELTNKIALGELTVF